MKKLKSEHLLYKMLWKHQSIVLILRITGLCQEHNLNLGHGDLMMNADLVLFLALANRTAFLHKHHGKNTYYSIILMVMRYLKNYFIISRGLLYVRYVQKNSTKPTHHLNLVLVDSNSASFVIIELRVMMVGALGVGNFMLQNQLRLVMV